MSQVTIYLTIALSLILIINMECAVIKIQEIPLSKDVIMKIAVKEDSDGDSGATIKISMSHKKKSDKILQRNLIDKFVAPASDVVPEFEDRLGIVNGNCSKGKVRRGPLCL
ncbi:unnamed protein product [Euphydryas editha]|uniref:Uncharacterized protein n=1 Tax=Euphydryas editha TaxID=104508 RepID=A0AAU9U701_EUPED|nr:unnamed protein product [Euphydryas editha]CAH2093593.1 unnamed protein product [Euphydryas editha]